MGGEVGRHHGPATLNPCRSILKGAQPGAGLRPPVGIYARAGGLPRAQASTCRDIRRCPSIDGSAPALAGQ